MRKFLTCILVTIAAVISPIASHAISNELKEIQTIINAQCPMDCGDGNCLIKVVFTEDNTFQWHMSAKDFAGYTKAMITPQARREFRMGFLEEMTSDSELVQICRAYGLKLILVMYTPSGQELFRETFNLSDFK